MTFQNNGYSPRSNSGSRGSYAPQEPPAKAFPKDYVDFAERYMKEHYRQITTSKLRNLLSLLGELIEFGKTRQVFSYPREKKTEDYITGRFG